MLQNEDPSFLSANEVDDDYRQYYPPHMSEAREWRVRIFTMVNFCHANT